jgi:hypothetical protein
MIKNLRLPLATIAMALSAAPAMAQSAATSGPSLLWVWGWILVAGIIIMIAGTSFGAGSRR